MRPGCATISAKTATRTRLSKCQRMEMLRMIEHIHPFEANEKTFIGDDSGISVTLA